MDFPSPQSCASLPAITQYASRPPDAATGAHPFLWEPKLYILNLDPLVTDLDLVHAFEHFVPFQPTISRDSTGQPINGCVDFKHMQCAEKALATLNGSLIPNTRFYLHLSPFSTQSAPPPLATPRLVKDLPPFINDSFLYDLFRPYGAIASAKIDRLLGAEYGVVHFWREDDAARAEQTMHYAKVGDREIVVGIFPPPRRTVNAHSRSNTNPTTPTFGPGNAANPNFDSQNDSNEPFTHFKPTLPDMFWSLIAHGCPDITPSIDAQKYSGCRVAAGGFGDVWKGQMHDGTAVAVKVLRFSILTDGERKGLKRMAREIYNWSKLDHKNVNRLLGVTVFQGQPGMVSEWMVNGNLCAYLDRNQNVDRHELCVQIANGVYYIHTKNMVHGDLKASNILVSADGVVKLTDFDYSHIPNCSLLFTKTTRVGGGTLRRMAPELVTETSNPRSKLTDIYALGMTFLEVISGAPPYFPQSTSEAQVIFKVIQKVIPERSLEYFADNYRGNEMWRLLTQCWNHDAQLRPTAQLVLESLSSFLPTMS